MSKRPNWRKGVTEKEQSDDLLTKFTGESLSGMDPKKSTVYVFHHTSLQFAKRLLELYPELEDVKKFIELNDTSDTDNLTSDNALSFHEKFQKYTKSVLDKDPSFFENESLKPFDARAKFDSADETLKEEVWKYFHDLIQYSSMVEMYSRLPNGMIDTISNMAGGLMSKFQKGEMDINSLNPIEIGQMLMKDIKQEELESFGKSLLEGGNLENMMAMMQNTIGSSNIDGLMDMLKK